MSKFLSVFAVVLAAVVFGLFSSISTVVAQAAPQSSVSVTATPAHPIEYLVCFSLGDHMGSCDYFMNAEASFHRGDISLDGFYDEGVTAIMSDGTFEKLYTSCTGAECLAAIQWHWRMWAQGTQTQTSDSTGLLIGMVASILFALCQRLWALINRYGITVENTENYGVTKLFGIVAEVNPAIHLLHLFGKSINVDANEFMTYRKHADGGMTQDYIDQALAEDYIDNIRRQGGSE